MSRIRTGGPVAVATAVVAVALGGCGSQHSPSQPDDVSSFGFVVGHATPSDSLKVTLENVPGDPTGDATPQFSDGTPDPTTSAPLAPDAPHYVTCSRAAAPSSRTNLRPVQRIDASNAKQGGAQPLPLGAVRVESGGTLALDDGRLAAGNGYDAGVGGGQMAVRVTTRKVLAPVTLVVLDSPSVGRRVAFVEVRITTTAPVSWTQEPNLGIVTDGGDGGFVRGTAEALRDDQSSPDAYIDAFYPNSDSASGNVCVQRITHTGQLDAVMFTTGYGDGGYPTFVGRDKDGVIASVVHDSGVLPWRMSGLPGTPPPADETG